MGILQLLRGAKRPEVEVEVAGATPATPASSAAGVGMAADGNSSSAAAAALSPDMLTPIAGVTVEQYVAVCKGLAVHDYDQTRLPQVAGELGIDAAAWESAATGFNARVSASPAFARHFNTLYRAARVRAS